MTFQDFIYNLGLGHQQIIADGEIHRFKPSGNKSNSGWYISYPHFEYEAGVVGDWKTGLQENFCSINKSELTLEQKRQYAQQSAKAASQRKADEAKRHMNAKKEVNEIWGKASTKGAGSHPYLINKKVKILMFAQTLAITYSCLCMTIITLCGIYKRFSQMEIKGFIRVQELMAATTQ